MPEPESRSTATIGKAVRVVGQIFTKEDLYVDGDVEGTIESQENKVTIGPNGRVQASINFYKISTFRAQTGVFFIYILFLNNR